MMNLAAPARFVPMLGRAAWQRCAFDAATLVEGVVQLGWEATSTGGTPVAVGDPRGAGLAFDDHCRLFHSVPPEQRVERLLWDVYEPARAQDPAPLVDVLGGADAAGGAGVVQIGLGEAAARRGTGSGRSAGAGRKTDTGTGTSAGCSPGDSGRASSASAQGARPAPAVSRDGAAGAGPGSGFAPVARSLASFTPRALACDAAEHLYVLDSAANQVCIVDLQQRRVLRSQPLPDGAVDIAWHDGWLYGISAPPAPAPASLWRLAATRSLQAVDGAAVAVLAGVARLAFAEDGRLFVLHDAHQAGAAIVELGRPGAWLAAPSPLDLGAGAPLAFASDLVCVGCNGEEHLVVARRSEEDFLRVDIDTRPYGLAEPLTARHYDGLGIAASPEGRVVFWTPKGARQATAARLRYQSPGRVVGFRLDGGQHHGAWGRVLLDACIPANTAIRVHCLVGDDEDVGPRLVRTAPLFSTLAPIADEATTPLPLAAQLPGAEAVGQLLYKRSDGSEQPWFIETEVFDTFETPTPPAPGRYLWIVFDLIGHSRATPKLRSVRAECPGHDWLRRLPQLYSRHDGMRSFLQRYLAPEAGLDGDLAAQAEARHALLNPASTAAAALPWLGGWLGLVLDERWSERAKRTFIAEAAWLFRLRGTVWAVRRMVEIVTGAPVVLVEQFRLRGLGRIGDDAAGNGWDEPALLGMGFRVGGPVGVDAVSGEADAIGDSFALHAHRFTVMVQAELDAGMEAVVRHLLDVHRPAHTLFTLCSVGAGMRIGRGLQLELTSVIGRSGRFATLQLGAGTLGRGQVLGRPAHGLAPENATLGVASRIG